MAEFNILDHWDALEPDGGSNDPKGDHSFKCPACGANNFKVHIKTGKWGAYSCDCSSSESGKRRIRQALSPAENPNSNPESKPRRPKDERHWHYFTAVTLERNEPAITVNRWDDPDHPDGDGWKKGRKISQTQQVAIGQATYQEVASKVQPYRLHDAKKALDDGAPYVFWPEGEPCCDALWELGLPAITNLGGSGKFNPERDGPHATGIPADRLVVVPDRDKPGIKHAESIAAAYPGCHWLYSFPGTPQWNGSMPENGGLDIADWIQIEGIKKQKILDSVGSRLTPNENKSDNFLVRATNTLQALKKGIDDINKLATPAERTIAQYSLRGQLGLDKDAYKQAVQDLLEEQDTPAPTSFEELMALDTGKEVSIEDLAAKGTLTLVAAEGHGGKSSLFYRMAEAISTGQPFAGRFKTTQGTVLIYQVDESPTDAKNKFRRMSLEPDNSRFLPRWKLSPSMIPELEQDIQDLSPEAVFADSLMRIFGGRGISLNDAEFGIWLYQLNNIASRYGTSFFLSHHLKKPEQQQRSRVTKHDLFGTAFLYNGTSDCWGLYPSQEDGARKDQFCLEFLKARSGIQDLGTVFDLQGCDEDYSWELIGIQGQTESIEECKIFADEVRDLLKLKGGHWTAQQVSDHFKQEGRSISNERARSTLVKLYERRQGIDRSRRMNQHSTGRPSWTYFAC